ncbi:hypothetical protein GCM10017687_34890 [Streptomyces echinatus]
MAGAGAAFAAEAGAGAGAGAAAGFGAAGAGAAAWGAGAAGLACGAAVVVSAAPAAAVPAGAGGGRSTWLVIGEEVPPGAVYRIRVLEVLLIDLVDEPLVRTERGSGVLPGLVVGGDARVTGGLWRHGGNRPLPLHKVMDSGNKGYASKTVKVRSGPFIVA